MSGIASYSTTPASNTSINGISIAENCNASNINDAIRQLMADIAIDLSGLGGLSGVSGSVAENTNTTLFSPGAASGIWVVWGHNSDNGSANSMAIYYAINGGTNGFLIGAQYNSGVGAGDMTFISGGTSIQAKRNSGAGTGTITWTARKLI